MNKLDVLCRAAAIGIARHRFLARPTNQQLRLGRWGYAPGTSAASCGEIPAPRPGRHRSEPVSASSLCRGRFFFWALTRLIFEDGFRLRAAHWLWLGTIEVAGLAAFVPQGAAAQWISDVLGGGFRLLSLALRTFPMAGLAGPSADLVEARAGLRRVVTSPD